MNQSKLNSISFSLPSLIEPPAKSRTEASKDGAKKDNECSYIEELDKITKETKAKRDLQDKEIVETVKLKQKQKNAAPAISESEPELNPVPKKARIAHKAGDTVVSFDVRLTATKRLVLPKANRLRL